MTDQKKKGTTSKHSFEEDFAALSLEEKIAALLRMEAATLGETLTFIANSSAKAVEKAGEFIQDVGEKIEKEVKKAAAASAGAARTTSSGDSTKQKESGPASKSSSGKRPPKADAAK